MGESDMNEIEKNRRKFTALLVLLTFLFTSIIPTNLGSWDSRAEAATDAEILQNNNQIVKIGDSFAYKEENKVSSSTKHDVEISKKVTPTGTENDFNIELKVITSENVDEVSTFKTGAAVVLVMDTSKSMQWNNAGGGYCFQCQRVVSDADTASSHGRNCSETSGNATYAQGAFNEAYETTEPMRVTSAVDVADAFLSQFAHFDTAMFSMVTFDADARAHQINGQYWLNVGRETDGTDLSKAHSELRSLDNYIASRPANDRTPAVRSGTNIAGGLQVAYNLLESLGADAPKNRYVIFLSDGAPNRGLNNLNAPGYNLTGAKNGNYYGQAETVANRVHADADVYSIGFSPDVSGSETLNLLQHIASSSDKYYYASTPDELIADFKKITQSVTLLAEAWQVTDTMGDNIHFLGFGNSLSESLSNSQGVYCTTSTVDGKTTIDWDLTKTGAVNNGDGTYTYSITYRVRLDTTASDFVNEKAYDTNSSASLQYVVKNDSTGLYNGPYNVAFDKPQVKGYTTDINFKKTDGTNPLSGAAFTLRIAENASHEGSYSQISSVSDANGTIGFSDVPSGHTYVLSETTVPVGYLLVADQTVYVKYGKFVGADGITSIKELINTPKRGAIVFTKTDDLGNSLPGALFGLYSNATCTELIQTAQSDSNGIVSFASLLPGVYYVKEITAPSNYFLDTTVRQVTVVSGDTLGASDGIAKISNASKTEATVKKIWDDNNNQDGIRPTELAVGLSNGQKVILNHENNWTATVSDLPKYDAVGNEIVYKWTESSIPAGYTLTATNIEGTVTTLTNKHVPERMNVIVNKTWVIPEGETVTLPADNAVKVQLLKNNVAEGEEVGIKIKNKPSSNVIGFAQFTSETITWTDLPRYENGMPIIWDVEEHLGTQANNYAFYEEITREMVNGVYTVTINMRNTYDPIHRSLLVNKVWNDNDNQDSIRPSSVDVELQYSLDNGTSWHAVPNNDTPNTAQSAAVLTVGSNESDFFSTVDGIVTLSDTNNVSWGYIWDKLPQYHNSNQSTGTPFIYKVVETTYDSGGNWILTGYDGADDGNNDISTGEVIEAITGTTWSLSLTNYHTPYTTDVTVKKVWEDNNNQDGKRPTSVTFKLYANGIYANRSVTLPDEHGNWTYTWEDLQKYVRGNEITYRVYEVNGSDVLPQGGTTSKGYVVTYSGTKDADSTDCVITNTYTPETTAANIQKIWDDNNNQDGSRPDNIYVSLLANNVMVTKDASGNTLGDVAAGVFKLDAHTFWAKAINNLPKYANGTVIDYSWAEVKEQTVGGVLSYVPIENDGKVTVVKYGKEFVYSVVYAESHEDNQHNTVITNRYTPEVTSATVEKVWNDANNQDGKRPDSLIVILSNGTMVTLNAANSWKATVENLPKYANGQLIQYTWSEGAMPEGYTLSSVSVDGTVTKLTNSYTPETTTATVQKEWDDLNNQDGIRPNAVYASLWAKVTGTDYTYRVDKDASGNDVGNVAGSPGAHEITKDTEWSRTIGNLPKYSDGKLIEYYWEEDVTKLPSGYELSAVRIAENTTTLTNKHVPERMNVVVNKTWVIPAGETVTLPLDNEVALQLLKNNIAQGDEVGIKINSRPSSAVTGPMEFTSETITWIDLPRYENGKQIIWDVEEHLGAQANNYKFHEEITRGMVDGVYTVRINISNTYDPLHRSLLVNKVWEDNDNQDGIRPAEITVQLNYSLNNGASWHAVPNNDTPNTAQSAAVLTVGSNESAFFSTVDGIVTLSDTNNVRWGYIWDNLPQYHNSDQLTGTDIIYKVKEVTIPDGYYGKDDHGVITDVVEDITDTAWTLTLTNYHTPYTTNVTIEKIWNDANNQDGKRPNSVRFQLYANGIAVGTPVIVTPDAEGNWAYKWNDLQKYEDGSEITYRVREMNGSTALGQGDTTNEGYIVTYTANKDANGTNCIATNTYTPETTEATVKKVWNDTNNQDGKRPASLDVTLNNGTVVTLNASNGWSATVTNLPVYKDGQKIVYSWTEAAITDYTLTNIVTAGTVTTLTNTHIPETTEATVKKVWDDANNQDGIRPASLDVTLSNGTEVTLNAANSWSATVTDLPMYKDGAVITYTWIEDSVSGYVLTNTDFHGTITTLTNTHSPEKVNIPITKVWNDSNNQDDKRPDEITLQLFADSVKVDGAEITLMVPSSDVVTGTDANGNTTWSYVWKELDKYKNGKEIVYRVREVDPSNGLLLTEGGHLGEYTVHYVRANDGAISITNSYEPETITVKMQKVWQDAANQDGSRPNEVYVSLLADGVVVTSDASGNTVGNLVRFPGVHKVDESTEWAKAISNLPVYANGTKIQYTWVELQKTTDASHNITYKPLTDGKVIFTNASGKSFVYSVTSATESAPRTDGIWHSTITNTYTPEKVKVVVNKKWVIPAGETVAVADLPDSGDVTVTLLKNNVALANNDTPQENEIDGVKKVTFAGKPTSGSVSGYQEFVEVPIVWDNLARYNDGIEIIWDVTETLGEYANRFAYSETVTKGVVDGVYTITINITNTYDLIHRSLAVNKIWKDNNNQDGIRPYEITVQLYYKWGNHDWEMVPDRNVTTETPENNELNSANDNAAAFFSTIDGNVQLTPSYGKASNLEWGYIWDNLPQYHNNDNSSLDKKEISYKVVEEIPAGYDSTPNDGDNIAESDEVIEDIVEPNSVWSATLINYHEVDTKDVTVWKYWDDNNDQDDKRPSEVTVQLYANGDPYSAEVILSAANNWSYTWENVPVYKNGNLIKWTVREIYEGNHVRPGGFVENGYVVAYSFADVTANGVTEGDCLITNRYTPETISIPVTKIWNDANNQDGKRSESVTVKLLADGTEVDSLVISKSNDEILIDGNNQWTASFTNLQKYRDNGIKIVYTVKEIPVAGYTDTISGNAKSYSITNTHTPETISVSGEKVWDDNHNQDGKRPTEITVRLYADGTEVASKTVSGTGDTWTYEFTGLPRYDNGVEIVYTVTEDAVSGYTAEINGYDISNSYTPQLTAISGTKHWIDNNNETGVRPDEITVKLFADNVWVDSQDVTTTSNWQYHFDKLPKYKNGKQIVYTIEETVGADLSQYYDKNNIQYVKTADGYDIVNTLVQKYFDISGVKQWVDKSGKEINPPDGQIVEIKLFRDNVVADTTTTSALKDWSFSFTELPRYALEAGGDAHLYNYRIEETPVDGYTPSYEVTDNFGNVKVVITNTAGEAQYVSISGEKIWQDNNNAMNLRPESIEVALMLEGTKVDSKVIGASEDWSYSFENLPRFDEDGIPYKYTVEEVTVPEGYLSTVVATANGYDIVNTLYTADAGSITVSKVVEGDKAPAKDVPFNFVLRVKSTVNDWDAMMVYKKWLLDEAWEEAVAERTKAESKVEAAEDAFKARAAEITTSSAYRLIMTKDVSEDITSGSVYVFKAVNQYGNVVSNGTTGSSYDFVWEYDKVDKGKETGIVQRVINAIKHLAAQFSELPSDSKLLKALYGAVLFGDVTTSSGLEYTLTTGSAIGYTTASAIGFVHEDADWLFDAQRDLLDAEALVHATTEAALKFVEENVTTPTAIKLILTPSSDKLPALEYQLDQDDLDENGFYKVAFDLFADTNYSVRIEATTGAAITYDIEEVLNPPHVKDYEGTKVMVNGVEVSENAVPPATGEQKLDKSGAVVVFRNVYEDENPYIPPYIPPYVPKDPDEPEEPEPTPKDPEDSKEPPVEPGTEIPNEPEDVPEDVVPTGDTNHPAPYFVMMLIGFFGMLFTRRRVK